MKYIIETRHEMELLALLDAVGLLVEPLRRHKPSTDTLIFFDTEMIRHSRLDLTIKVKHD